MSKSKWIESNPVVKSKSCDICNQEIKSGKKACQIHTHQGDIFICEVCSEQPLYAIAVGVSKFDSR